MGRAKHRMLGHNPEDHLGGWLFTWRLVIIEQGINYLTVLSVWSTKVSWKLFSNISAILIPLVKGHDFNLALYFLCGLNFFWFLHFELGVNSLTCSGILLFLHDFMYVCIYLFLLLDITCTNSSNTLACEFSGPGDLHSFTAAQCSFFFFFFEIN